MLEARKLRQVADELDAECANPPCSEAAICRLAAAEIDRLRAIEAAMPERERAVYLLGFNTSGEGYNGQYPFRDKGRLPETNPGWIVERDFNLAAASKREQTK